MTDGYIVRATTRDFINLGAPGEGFFERAAFEVVWGPEADRRSGFVCDRVAASDKPVHVAAAKRAAEAQLRRAAAYLAKTGRRWEVVAAEERAAKRAAEVAERDARAPVRAAAPALLAALRDLVEVVESGLDAGLILSVDGKRPELQALRVARETIAQAEGRS